MKAISLCIIAQNEESRLEACLQAAKNYVDEIVIVDTGSKDRTKEIALRYTDRVYDFQWVNDFAAARNFSISMAAHEYILVLDCDEIIIDIDIEKIRQLMDQYPEEIGRLQRINEFTRDKGGYRYAERVNRLFSKRFFRYEGIIHEQLVRIKEQPGPPEDNSYLIPITIRHSGYDGDLETRKRKTDRNITLLLKALAVDPDDPYLLYQLGKSYYMQEDYRNAADYFGRALQYDLDIRLEYVQDMVESYGYSLINSGQYEAAMQLLNVYNEFSHSADFVFMIALVLMNNAKFPEAIAEFKKAATRKECKMEGVNGHLAYHNIAVIYDCLGEQEKAKRYYDLAKDSADCPGSSSKDMA